MKGGVSVVQGEVAQLLSAVRKTGRWSGHGRTVSPSSTRTHCIHILT